ncbi:MAG: hypothetical protein ABIP30_15405 [Ferruginibacter sp.]
MMTKTKTYLALIITFLIIINCNAQKTSVRDFDKLVGSWEGSLTYLDYSSGKPYTMSADIEI